MSDSPSSLLLPMSDAPPRPAPYPLLSDPHPELDLSCVTDWTPESRGQSRDEEQKKVCFRDPVVGASQHNSRLTGSTGRPSRSQKTTGPVLGRDSGSSTSDGRPFALEGVELNTTLCLKAEIQALQASEFHPQKAVEKTLKNSGRTKKRIDSRATEGVNVTRSKLLFNSLVSVSVQEEQLLRGARQERLQPTPPSQPKREEPELTPFFHLLQTSDLFRQKPLPPEEEEEESLPWKQASCRPFPAASTFDLHTRQRRWES